MREGWEPVEYMTHEIGSDGDFRVDNLRQEDIVPFMQLAAGEGWLCERWEFDFLLAQFPEGGLVVRATGIPVAFVTSIKYGTSGWIGNLIVAPGYRGRGLGTFLMKRALAALAGRGARTFWLTASEEGKPIYERLGFTVIDGVKRWRGEGKGKGAMRGITASIPEIVALDAAGWGDCRKSLLSAILPRSEPICTVDGFLFIQHWPAGFQLGPWSAVSLSAAVACLDRALARIGAGTLVFLDVPANNVTAAAILSERGFRVTGRTTLMYAGEKPEYDPGAVFALASMGSMG